MTTDDRLQVTSITWYEIYARSMDFFHCNQKPGGLRHTKSDSVQACSCSCLTWIHSDTSFWFITPWHMRDLS